MHVTCTCTCTYSNILTLYIPIVLLQQNINGHYSVTTQCTCTSPNLIVFKINDDIYIVCRDVQCDNIGKWGHFCITIKNYYSCYAQLMYLHYSLLQYLSFSCTYLVLECKGLLSVSRLIVCESVNRACSVCMQIHIVYVQGS